LPPFTSFVAVLGASSYAFAEATESQDLACWIGSHIRAFEFLGGTAKLVVPDNCRTGVSRACRYEPDLNRTYHEMATHYGVGVLPTRRFKARARRPARGGKRFGVQVPLPRFRAEELDRAGAVVHGAGIGRLRRVAFASKLAEPNCGRSRIGFPIGAGGKELPKCCAALAGFA
jgi:hypothetical protein